MTLTNTGK